MHYEQRSWGKGGLCTKLHFQSIQRNINACIDFHFEWFPFFSLKELISSEGFSKKMAYDRLKAPRPVTGDYVPNTVNLDTELKVVTNMSFK